MKVLSDVPVSRNWYKTVSNLYENSFWSFQPDRFSRSYVYWIQTNKQKVKLLSFIFYILSFIFYLLYFIFYLSFFIFYLLAVIFYILSFIFYILYFIFYLFSFIFYFSNLLTFLFYLLSLIFWLLFFITDEWDILICLVENWFLFILDSLVVSCYIKQHVKARKAKISSQILLR